MFLTRNTLLFIVFFQKTQQNYEISQCFVIAMEVRTLVLDTEACSFLTFLFCSKKKGITCSKLQMKEIDWLMVKLTLKTLSHLVSLAILWRVGVLGLICWLLFLALFRMDHFGATHNGWWGEREGGLKKSTFHKTCHAYPTMQDLTVIPYLKKMKKIHKSRDTNLKLCCHHHFFSRNRQLLLHREIQI